MSINSPLVKMTQIKSTIKFNDILYNTHKKRSTTVESKRQKYKDKWEKKELKYKHKAAIPTLVLDE